jgi:hypothetical protein
MPVGFKGTFRLLDPSDTARIEPGKGTVQFSEERMHPGSRSYREYSGGSSKHAMGELIHVM